MQEEYDALLASSQYRSFISENESHKLVNVFILYSKQYGANWQFGFYNEEIDKIVAFIVKNEDGVFVIEQQEQDETAKEPTTKLLELSLNTVTLSPEKALDVAIACVENEYKSDAAQSRILLLQNTAEFGTIWNATVISQAFDVINVKVDATNGEIKQHSKHSLLDMNANKG